MKKRKLLFLLLPLFVLACVASKMPVQQGPTPQQDPIQQATLVQQYIEQAEASTPVVLDHYAGQTWSGKSFTCKNIQWTDEGNTLICKNGLSQSRYALKEIKDLKPVHQ